MSIRRTIHAAAAAGVLSIGLAGSASAVTPLSAFNLNINGIDGLQAAPDLTVANINEITLNGVFHVTATDNNGNAGVTPGPDSGDTFTVTGYTFATGFSETPPAAIADFGLNDPSFLTVPAAPPFPFVDLASGGWEMTFVFTVGGTFGATSFDVGTGITTFPFVHTAGGILDVYIDNLSPGDGAQADTAGTVSDFTTGGGGVKVASFTALAGDGGTIDVLADGSLDGNDTISFVSTFFEAGVFFDGLTADNGGKGRDLKDLLDDGTAQTIAFVGTDLTPFGGVFPVFGSAGDPAGACLATALQTPFDTCGIEDGSTSLSLDFLPQVMPEPASLAILGFGLIGAAGIARRRRVKKA